MVPDDSDVGSPIANRRDLEQREDDALYQQYWDEQGPVASRTQAAGDPRLAYEQGAGRDGRFYPVIEDTGYRARLVPGYERIAVGNTRTSQIVDEISNLMQTGENKISRNPREAMQAFGQAQTIADSIDPAKLQRQQEAVKKQLEVEQDPRQRRLLKQEQMDLYSLEQASKWTRCNQIILFNRMGLPADAMRVAGEAYQRFPELRDPRMAQQDPVLREFWEALYSLQDQLQRGGDPRRQAQLDQRDPRLEQRYPQGPPQQQQGRVTEQQQQQQQRQQEVPQQQQQQRQQEVQQQQTAQATPLRDGLSPFQRVSQLNQLAKEKGLTPEIDQAYRQAIADADIGASPRVAQLEQAKQQIAAEIQAKEAEVKPKVQAIDTRLNAILGELKAKNPNDEAAMNKMLESLAKAKTQAEKDQILQQMARLSPPLGQEFVTKLKERDALMAPIMALEQSKAEAERQLVGEKNQAAIVRYEYAQQLEKAGKKPEAKQVMLQAVQKNNDPNLAEFFRTAAVKLGATDQEIAQALQKAQQAQAQVTDKPGQQQPGTTQTGELSPAAQLQKANRAKIENELAKAPDEASRKALLEKMKPDLTKAVQMADSEYAETVKAINEVGTQLKGRYDAFVKGLEDKAKGGDATAKADFDALKSLDNPNTPDSVADQLLKKYPELGKIMTEQATFQQQGQAALDEAVANRFAARYDMANALALGGDKAGAKTALEDAFKQLSVADRQEAVKEPYIQKLVTDLGVDVAKLPPPTDAVTAGGTQQPGAGGDVLAQIEQKLKLAQHELKNNKNVEAAKKEYKDAIALVDGQVNHEENNKKIKELLDAVKKETDPNKRFQMHGELAMRYDAAIQSVAMRTGYGRVMQSYGQNAEAEKAFKDARDVAKLLPTDLMKQHADFLRATEFDAFKNDRDKAAEISSLLTMIQGENPDGGFMNVKVNANKDLAAFYVRLPMAVDEQGRPIYENGKPKRVPDVSEVFKPQEAIDAINQAKAEFKAITGKDLDDPANKGKDPLLSELAYNLAELDPTGLAKKQANLRGFWSSAISDPAAGAVGLAIIIAGAALLKRPSIAAKLPRLIAAGGEGLSLTGKVALGATALTGASLTRHGANYLITGEHESAMDSIIHGGAGTLGMLGMRQGGRAMGRLLFRSSGGWDDVARQGAALEARGLETVGQARAFYASKGIQLATHAGEGTARVALDDAMKLSKAGELLKAAGKPLFLVDQNPATIAHAFQQGIGAGNNSLKIAEKLASGFSHGGETKTLKTVGELRDFVNANPAAFGKGMSFEKLFPELMQGIGKGTINVTDDIASIASKGIELGKKGGAGWEGLAKLADVKQVGRFAQYRDAGSGRIMAALKTTRDGIGAQMPWGSIEDAGKFSISARRFGTGALGAGPGYYLGYKYPVGLYGSMVKGDINPDTGKQYTAWEAIKAPLGSPTELGINLASMGFFAPAGNLAGISNPWRADWGPVRNIGNTAWQSVPIISMGHTWKYFMAGPGAKQAIGYAGLLTMEQGVGAWGYRKEANRYEDLLQRSKAPIIDAPLVTEEAPPPQDKSLIDKAKGIIPGMGGDGPPAKKQGGEQPPQQKEGAPQQQSDYQTPSPQQQGVEKPPKKQPGEKSQFEQGVPEEGFDSEL